MSAKTRAWLQIHFCVLLWGFTAILGKLISLPALPLVWWRMLIVALVLLLVPRIWRHVREMGIRTAAAYAGIGLIVALHWVTFYGSIKLANASVAATCMAMTPVFLALVEPWIAKRPFDRRELLLGVLVIPGIVLVVGGTPLSMRLGVAVGIFSAFCVSLFGSLNKRMAHGDALTVTFLEMSAGAIAITLIMPFATSLGGQFVIPDLRDAWLLAALAIGCTLLPFALSLVALRELTAFGTTLAVNLEPVYAIILASVLLGEQRELTTTFYIGVTIILVIVFVYPFLGHDRKDPQTAAVNATMQ